MFELETLVEECLRVKKTKAYIKTVAVTGNSKMCQKNLEYALLVRAKHLQMTTEYYLFNGDVKQMAYECECFNKDFIRLSTPFKREVGLEFEPGKLHSVKIIQGGQDDRKDVSCVTKCRYGYTHI